MAKASFYNFGYNKDLQPLASKLRKSMTKAEACIWKFVLKGKQLKGYPFRRQRPVLKYIADFLCKELMLIIEIDGITHDHEEAILKDEQREKDLKKAGFKIVRFSDDEVLTNMTGIAKQLERVIADIEASTPCPRRRGCHEVTGVDVHHKAYPLACGGDKSS